MIPPADAGELEGYWALPPAEAARRLGSRPEGLSAAEAARRLRVYGRNELRAQSRLSRLGVFLDQVRSPLLWILIFAAGAAALTGAWLDASIVLIVIAVSVAIGCRREYSARAAVAALQERLRVRVGVLRDGRAGSVAVDEIVPGDVALLSAGSLVPADGVLLEATDLFVSEAVLTGESFPVQKRQGAAPASARLAERANCLFFGTNVRSGTASLLVARTGGSTEYGAIARRLMLRPPEAEFDRGIRKFGYMLTRIMFVMVVLVFAAHMLRGRPPIETLLFSVALAVGLSPELLPVILNVSLARGAQNLARLGVLVRRLNAIENLGSMDVLCTDKTGTLTEGIVSLEGAYDDAGASSDSVLELAALNAALETGLSSPLDDAILQRRTPDSGGVRKLAEIPFDFTRKRVSVVVETARGVRLISKGEFHHVLEACSRGAGGAALDRAGRAALERLYRDWSSRGLRVLAVAARELLVQEAYKKEDEQDLSFMGFLVFLDHPKEGVAEALAQLGQLGVSVKVITGDNRLVARHVAGLVGMRAARLLTGRQLDRLHDEALWHTAEKTDIFAEVDPNQKERIILALKKMGHVVGFLGDGVNDASAMHAADAGLSVQQAVDVARQAADFVLLERHLDVIRRGIEEGRRTFANSLKYIMTAGSANLGNMISMAAASLMLPFLPMAAVQILLNNLLADVPALGLADDSVDPELVERPRRWDMRFIGAFMIAFGSLSSVFDFMTFAALLALFHAGPDLFRTGWFVESLLTQLVIALVVRTRRRFYRSRPGRLLLASTVAVVSLTLAIPYLPKASLLGFVPLPGLLLVVIILLAASYVAATEGAKPWFYRRFP